MAKITIGPIDKGLRTDRLPFVIDNDSFPTLVNAYQWRGRLRRKRGTSPLVHLARFFNSNSTAYSATASFNLVAGAGNLITGFSLQTNASLVPGSINILVAGNTFTDPGLDGVLVGNPAGTGTVNYASGAITITGGGVSAVSGSFRYFPDLPVLGLEDLQLDTSGFTGTLAFDQTFAYNVVPSIPYSVYDVSFYKNPVATGALPGYVPKPTPTATSWNGQDYQQFWSTNYQNAFWVTNGIQVPFNVSNIGLQFSPASDITFNAVTATTITLTIANCPLVVGDFVFLNEFTTAGGVNEKFLNFQTGYVTASSINTPPLALKTVTITFSNSAIPADVYTPGIIQYLTTRRNTTIDCIRWYDGDPTNQSATAPGFVQGFGFVNFMPPLSRASFSIADTPPAQYYLAGARMILPFKDRILFIGPVIQTASSFSTPIYLPDTVIYSQNGTAYYTASFNADPTLSTTVQFQVLVPPSQTSTVGAYWEDVTGFGGFVSAGVQQEILTAVQNEDVIIMGFPALQTRFVDAGNDIVPFKFFFIDSELSSASTFSAINMGRSVLSRGNRGFISTTQREAQRFDEDILPTVLQIGLDQNGAERFTAQRDFMNEWVYFTYRSNQVTYRFPTQTLQYNYRDSSWAIFNESYTHYGLFRTQTGYTWANIGLKYPTWAEWSDPWNSLELTLLNPIVIAGNQQGFIVIRDDGTDEADSLYIQNISGATVTSPDHCLNEGDFIVINNAIGLTGVNGQIFSVNPPITQNTFALNPIPTLSGTYVGGGTIQRMYVPFIQSKQFPAAWGLGRKTRIGVQQYLITSTDNGQIQLLIFLSQNSAEPYNDGPINPQMNVVNNALIYSSVLYTAPESTNLGLTPANTNLLMYTNPTGVSKQDQIWHRVNTSLIGDTVQIGFTMSDSQMRDTNFNNQFTEIEIHGFTLEVYPSQMLA